MHFQVRYKICCITIASFFAQLGNHAEHGCADEINIRTGEDMWCASTHNFHFHECGRVLK